MSIAKLPPHILHVTAPTSSPTNQPTPAPTDNPAPSPSNAPSASPTAAPISPTYNPTTTTDDPTPSPTDDPTTADPTVNPTTTIPSYAPSPRDPWVDALTLGYPNNEYLGEYHDIGQTEFNRIFREESSYHIIKRECSTCLATHQYIYYRRFTMIDTFDVYNLMKLFTSTNNAINTDFKLYSTLDDAILDTNAWSYCNYDDITYGIGAFRDCGPSGFVGCQITGDKDVSGWSRYNCGTAHGMHDTKFSIYVDFTSNPTSAPSPEPSQSPTFRPSKSPLPGNQTYGPTIDPTSNPSKEPSQSPSIAPTRTFYELIIKQDAGYYFSDKNVAKSSNENDPTATLYSIIDTFDTAKQSLYKDIDGKFQFRLEYDNNDNTETILEWKQSNWLLDNYVTDSEFIDVPTQSGGCEIFYGLALSGDGSTLIDGNGLDGCWYVRSLHLNAYIFFINIDIHSGGMPLVPLVHGFLPSMGKQH